MEYITSGPLETGLDVWITIIAIGLFMWSIPFAIFSCCMYGKRLSKQKCLVNSNIYIIFFVSGISMGILWHLIGYEWRLGNKYWANGKNGEKALFSPWTATYHTNHKILLLVPKTENELRENVLSAGFQCKGRGIRVVGSGHSWSATGFSNCLMIDIRLLNNVIRFDGKTITVQAGMKVQELVNYLFQRQYCIYGAGSIRAQSIGGVVSQGVHGPHPDGFNRHVVGLRVLLANGTFMEINSNSNAYDMYMWRASMGMLGVIVETTLEVFPLQWLRLERSAIISFSELDNMEKHLNPSTATTYTGFLYPLSTSFFSCSWKKHIGWKRVGYFINTSTAEKHGNVQNIELKNQSDFSSRLLLQFNDHMHAAMQYISFGYFGNIITCMEQVFADWGHSVMLSGPEYDVLPNDGLIPQFYELIDYEYMVPLQHCRRFAEELMIEQKFGRVLVPICLRLVRAEISCFSMAQEDSCIFAIQSMRGMAYTLNPIAIEKRVGELGGRSHLGKVAAGNFQYFKFDCIEKFKDYRQQMDPENLFMTSFSETVLYQHLSPNHIGEFSLVTYSRHISILRSYVFGATVYCIVFGAFYFVNRLYKKEINMYTLIP
jgi:hypothetical protein